MLYGRSELDIIKKKFSRYKLFDIRIPMAFGLIVGLLCGYVYVQLDHFINNYDHQNQSFNYNHKRSSVLTN